ncbi:hypothetical protein D1AOALGA4SA_13065, partial [Olavius algarvensis Delta 1 endosymbiont]
MIGVKQKAQRSRQQGHFMSDSNPTGLSLFLTPD